MTKPLIVYKASAGSGKTFTLATEYIKLVVRNPQSYRQILAVTFTNKATEEMKTRILSQLYGIAHGLSSSESYLNVVCRELDASPEFVRKQAATALQLLLHNYSYFRVETIDTFFQSVLRNLARELELTANLRIGLNDSQVEELAVDQLIESLSTTDVVLQWIMKYIMDNISDDRSWNVIGQIKQFGKTIFRDYYKRESKQLEAVMSQDDFFDRYTATLRQLREQARERMLDVAESFFSTLESEGLTVDDLSYGKSGVAGIFCKLREGVLDESILTKRVTDAVGQPEKWCKKTHPRRDLIYALADGELGDVLRYAIDERPRAWKQYQSATLTLNHLSQLRLLGSIEQRVHQLNEEQNRFLLSDTQKFLHDLIEDSDSPFIFEKIGTQLEHIMIDEFQDTSTVQWQNFKVLLDETMSHEDSESLIVGDVKQSIYRWRSGDWRLLADIKSQFTHADERLDIRTLDTNFRSTRRIVDFNNAFFTQAARQEEVTAYDDVRQQVPQGKGDEGEVDIRLLPADDYQETTLSLLTERVQELMDKGVSPSEIAILVRVNSLIPLIANYFMEQLPQVSIVSDEAFRLDASPAVMCIVQAIRQLVMPTDNIARAYLAKMAGGVLPPAYDEQRNELMRLPLYELAERLLEVFRLHELEGQNAYLCAFFDQMAAFVSESSTDLVAFLREWDESLCAKTIQSDELTGIRLISIHKSKGLEFPYVLIPFCDWQLEKTQGNILWCKPEEAPFNELPIAPIDYSQKGMMGTIYEPDYLEEHQQNTVDNLNLLYVAFTRASRGLYVTGKRGAKASRSALLELVLPAIVDQLQGATLDGMEDDGQPLCFSYGDTRVCPADKAQQQRPSDNIFTQQPATVEVPLEVFSGKAEFKQSNKSRELAMSDDDDEQQQTSYIQLGSVLHNVFQHVRTAADIDSALREMELEGIIYNEEITRERIELMLRKRLQAPRVADWFSGRWTLFNECTILFVDPATGKVVERRPDRVMGDGSQMVVVDFKFGREREEYHAQVREYMELLRRMGHRQVTGYLWFVYTNKIVEVR